jgi:hypothetical protein
VPENTASWQASPDSESCTTTKDSVTLIFEFHHWMNLPSGVEKISFSGLIDCKTAGRNSSKHFSMLHAY